MVEAAARNVARTNISSSRRPPTAFRKFILSSTFDHCAAVLLFTNSLFIGVQVELAYQESVPSFVSIIDYIYCVGFIIELVLRLYGLGCYQFFCGEDKVWNWFDFVIVGISTADSVISLVVAGQNTPFSNISVLRIVRMVRIMRVFRMIRMMRFFRDLRVMVSAIVSTIRTACWALILLLMATYIFGVALAQIVGEHVGTHRDAGEPLAQDDPLLIYFGSLLRVVCSLFMSISGGIDWADGFFPLMKVNWVSVIIYLFFILFASFCMLNVIIGIFCQNAMAAYDQDREKLMEAQMKERKKYVDSLTSLFNEWDSSGDGVLAYAEFEEHLEDDAMLAVLKALEIERRDALTLFELLDVDGSGGLNIDEFICGCIQFRGGAKAVQIEKSAHDTRTMLKKLGMVEQTVDKLLSKFGESVQSLEVSLGRHSAVLDQSRKSTVMEHSRRSTVLGHSAALEHTGVEDWPPSAQPKAKISQFSAPSSSKAWDTSVSVMDC
jgi:hypothetical protein